MSVLRSYRVDGILLATAQSSSDHDSSHIESMVRAGVSVVCLDRALPNLPTDAVLLDNIGGARECVRHLLKRGHRRIAIITGALHLQTGFERLEGYKQALSEAGLTFDRKMVFEGDFRFQSGKLQCEHAMRLETAPTAIFICNGVMALGALQALDEMKLSFPRDVSLAAFDEVSANHATRSHITRSCNQPMRSGKGR